ncbi:MAG TPA: hypothetical protein VNX01_02205 [Bacteroidia bacterium]|jgi:hypothetical protein|nr:hypothetical protein [Bacteroidia bacterium]
MKHELRNLISGKNPVRDGELIQTISCYLKGSAGASQMAKEQKHYKKKETEVLKGYITKNNLWVPAINLDDYVSEGAEQKVYLNDSRHVIKLNDAIYYNSWEDYLNNLLLHNYFFTDTAYELTGFTEENDVLYAVVKQPFVKATEPTNLQLVKEFLGENGFINTKNHDYYNPQLDIILEDLHDENVLTKNGTLYFIDTVFYIKEGFYKD